MANHLLLRSMLRALRPPVKARPPQPEPAMTAILMILAFIVVIGALNYFEFGRLD
ncbi:hypothetical protein [Phenylobacterium sp.]|uniref:hypothetical protein n=1 Tax=Phenylobacterium sp. TaxID=1871053 RepID=UPI0027335B84|nr:hypothetical protein [Phenylobacterium sp.]MDP3852554.1 hypothetical protein [Phenylobacterium sp.]